MKPFCIQSAAPLTEPGGIYVHIPFCIRKCAYCDFYSITDTDIRPAFIKALIREMCMYDVRFVCDTLYFGGGTPSILEPGTISTLIETAYRHLPMMSGAEITLEVNPGTITFQHLKAIRKAGVNRLNIGVQSFEDKHLRFLGRIHFSDTTCLTIQEARKARFDNIGLDLIYGIPGQSEDSWISDLKKAISFKPEHLSCYMLTYEPGTPLEKSWQRGLFHKLSDKQTTELFYTTIDFLASCGYEQYEISNFARSSDQQSRHNRKYWRFAPYMGFGPSAHSFVPPIRYRNRGTVNGYLADIQLEKRPVESEESLTLEQQIIEAIYLGLRQNSGINVNTFEQNFGLCFYEKFKDTIRHLEDEEMLKTDSRHCALSRKGMVFLDSIAGMFISEQ